MVLLNDLTKPPDDDDPGHGPSPAARSQLMSLMVDGIAEQYEMLAVVQARVFGMVCEALRFARENTSLFTTSDDSEEEWLRRALTAELATALHVSERKAASLLSTSDVLVSELPATLDALRDGRITVQHAELMVSQSTGLDSDAKRDFEEKALPLAASSTPPQFRRRAVALRERLRPETITERACEAEADRRIEVYSAPDGMGWLSLYAPIAVTESIANAARSTAKSLKAVGDERTRPQIEADTVAEALMRGFTCEPAGETRAGNAHATGLSGVLGAVRPTVHVTVPVMTLLGHSDEPAELEGYGPIDPETARQLASQAPSFTRLLTHPETGAVLSVGRDRYAVPADLRKAIEIRDETCQFPGCNRPASECEIDHSVDWQYGGTTEIDNLSALCTSHHRLKHGTRWSIDRDENGHVVWTSPLGRSYVVRPSSNVGFAPVDSAEASPETPDGEAMYATEVMGGVDTTSAADMRGDTSTGHTDTGFPEAPPF